MVPLLMKMKLLNLNLSACSLKLFSDLLSLILSNCFLNSLRSCLNEILSVLKSKAGKLTNNLDNVELACACCLKNYVELGLLLCNGSCCASYGSCCNGSCGYTELLLESLNEISEFKNGKTLYNFKDLSRLFVHFKILQLFKNIL